jgi:hypothetical protein
MSSVVHSVAYISPRQVEICELSCHVALVPCTSEFQKPHQEQQCLGQLACMRLQLVQDQRGFKSCESKAPRMPGRFMVGEGPGVSSVQLAEQYRSSNSPPVKPR